MTHMNANAHVVAWHVWQADFWQALGVPYHAVFA
jgi:hypothetical protein